MKVRKHQASEEKTILTAMIVSPHVLGRIAEELGADERGPFKNKWSNLVAGWCLEYHRAHRKAPKKVINDLFHAWAAREPDDQSVGLVENFLASLSGEYARLGEELNEEWILKKAGEHFGRVRLAAMTQQVDNALENHDYKTAQEAWSGLRPVSFSERGWEDPFTRSNYERAVERKEKAKPLIQFRGDLGVFLSRHLTRGSFVSFAAPEKTGKSFWLQEAVWTAINQRRRVKYYMLGDMSKEQTNDRLFTRATSKPKEDEGPIAWPVEIKIKGKDEAGRPIPEVKAKQTHRKPWTIADCHRAEERMVMNAASKQRPLRLAVEAAGVVSASRIRADVHKMAEEGWLPDVVVIDYADLLAPEPGSNRMDFRHQVDATWKILRQISLEFNILVLTATQAAARSYDRWLIRKGDFSEDKRKNAHVTGMIGINRTPAEKDMGLFRLNWIFLRDGKWTETQYVWTAGNLALACPCIISAFKKT